MMSERQDLPLNYPVTAYQGRHTAPSFLPAASDLLISSKILPGKVIQLGAYKGSELFHEFVSAHPVNFEFRHDTQYSSLQIFKRVFNLGR